MTKPKEQTQLIVDRIRNTPDGELSALGACVFAGGFSFGVEEAGFRVAGHLELPDLALGAGISATRWPVVVAPLDGQYEARGDFPQDSTTWRSFIETLKDNDAVPDYLYMNPPCVAYAQQGSHKGMDADEMCYTRYCTHELAMGLQPTVWAWELVPGIFDDVKGGGRQFLEDMARQAGELGYRCYAFLTSAALHGGYQNRKRFHFVASRVELDFPHMYEIEPEERKGYKTLGDVIDKVAVWEAANGPAPNHEGDEKVSGGALLGIIPYCPPGGYLRNLNDEVMERYYRPRGKDWDGESRAGVTQVRGRTDRTCPVIVGGTSVIHPSKDRFLTIREGATAMGFPIDYKFSHGSKGYAEVGRGLCTHNASFLSRVVKDGLERNVAVTTNDGKLEVVDWRAKVSVPSQSSTPEEMMEWWDKRHPDMDRLLAKPRPKRGPGRPRGAKGKSKGSKSNHGPKKVLVSSFNAEGSTEMIELLNKMGFLGYGHPDGAADDLAALMGAVGGSDLVLIRGKPLREQFMMAGAALAKGTVVLFYGVPENTVIPEHPSIKRTSSSSPNKVVMEAGTAIGMTAADILQKMMVGQNAEDMLAMLLKQAS